MLLGVNIDHIAFLREARKINEPDPLEAVFVCKNAGAHQITIHLREDRRHINDDDCARIVRNAVLPVNIECSTDETIIDIICALHPSRATLVPEKREEVTTEGGLALSHKVEEAIKKLKEHEIEVSLFVDPLVEIVKKSKEIGADMVELHTGGYANIHTMLHSNLSRTPHSIKELEVSREELVKLLRKEIEKLKKSAKKAEEIGLKCAAGHGLNYHNVKPITAIQEIFELNIGQSIVARSIFTGLESAIKEMKRLIS